MATATLLFVAEAKSRVHKFVLLARRYEEVIGNPLPFVVDRLEYILEFKREVADFLQRTSTETAVEEVDQF